MCYYRVQRFSIWGTQNFSGVTWQATLLLGLYGYTPKPQQGVLHILTCLQGVRCLKKFENLLVGEILLFLILLNNKAINNCVRYKTLLARFINKTNLIQNFDLFQTYFFLSLKLFFDFNFSMISDLLAYLNQDFEITPKILKFIFWF